MSFKLFRLSNICYAATLRKKPKAKRERGVFVIHLSTKLFLLFFQIAIAAQSFAQVVPRQAALPNQQLSDEDKRYLITRYLVEHQHLVLRLALDFIPEADRPLWPIPENFVWSSRAAYLPYQDAVSNYAVAIYGQPDFLISLHNSATRNFRISFETKEQTQRVIHSPLFGQHYSAGMTRAATIAADSALLERKVATWSQLQQSRIKGAAEILKSQLYSESLVDKRTVLDFEVDADGC